VLASAFVATVADPAVFKTGRIGLDRPGAAAELIRWEGAPGRYHQGYLRQMLVVGAMAVIWYAERNGARRPWLVQLLARKATKLATIAHAWQRQFGDRHLVAD
jgi:transposase